MECCTFKLQFINLFFIMYRFNKHLILYFILGIAHLGYSQHISPRDKAVFFKDSIFVFCEHNLHKFSKTNLSKPTVVPLKYHVNTEVIPPVDDQTQEFSRMRIIADSLSVYFVSNFGGEVYQFKSGDSIKRIDNSYTHRMQIASPLFMRNDTLLRYGGYGFWSNRNILTYYDKSVNEWEKIAPLRSTEFPIGTKGSKVVLKDDLMVVLGGFTLDPNDLVTAVPNRDIWSYNFRTTKWSYIGKMNFDLVDYNFNFSYKTNYVFFGETDILVLNPFENKAKRYNKNVFHHKLILSNPNMNTIYNNGVFYCFSYIDNTNTVEIAYRNEDEFFGVPISEEKLYDDVSDWWYSLLLLLLPVGYFTMIKYKTYRKSKNKVKIASNGLVFHRIFYDFSAIELRVLRLLVAHETVQSADILAIVENKNHNYSHNMRSKVQLIEGLNYKLKMILKQEQDLIISKKSDFDKRIIVYEMDREYFV